MEGKGQFRQYNRCHTEGISITPTISTGTFTVTSANASGFDVSVLNLEGRQVALSAKCSERPASTAGIASGCKGLLMVQVTQGHQ